MLTEDIWMIEGNKNIVDTQEEDQDRYAIHCYYNEDMVHPDSWEEVDVDDDFEHCNSALAAMAHSLHEEVRHILRLLAEEGTQVLLVEDDMDEAVLLLRHRVEEAEDDKLVLLVEDDMYEAAAVLRSYLEEE